MFLLLSLLFPLYPLQDMTLHSESPVLRILKPGQVLSGKSSATDWTTFDSNGDPAFVPVAKALKYTRDDGSGVRR